MRLDHCEKINLMYEEYGLRVYIAKSLVQNRSIFFDVTSMIFAMSISKFCKRYCEIIE